MPEKPSKLMPALYGGVITGVISGVPFLNLVNCLCCAGVLFGGFMAVFFYKKDLTPETPPLESSDGLALGALSGVFGAIIGSVITGGLFFAIGNVTGETLYKMIMGLYDSMGILDQMPPEAIENMERSMMDSPISAFNMVMSLIVDTIFGLLGGLIGYAVFKPKAEVTPPPVVQP